MSIIKELHPSKIGCSFSNIYCILRTHAIIVCINIDDSGKLVDTQKVAIYAGLVYTSKKEKDKFITQYRSIVNELKCNYCKSNSDDCLKNVDCLELKHNMLKPSDNRRLMNYVKKYSILCCVINNDKVYKTIKEATASRGRFLDYEKVNNSQYFSQKSSLFDCQQIEYLIR